MQLPKIGALVFILIFWRVTASRNSSGQYDPNSIEQTQKLLRLLLRLAYHTANRLIRLKSQTRLKVEHVVDKDLQNITIKEMMNGSNLSAPEIQGRFFGLSQILDPSKSLKTIENVLVPKTSDLTNISSILGNPFKILNPINSSTTVKQSATNPQEITPNQILPSAGEIGSGVKPMTSLFRFLPTSLSATIKNSTIIKNSTEGNFIPNAAALSSDGIEGYKSQVMKRETSSVVSMVSENRDHQGQGQNYLQ